MNYAQIRKYDVANGPGIRMTLFVSGCTHDCESCFNKEYQDFNYGSKWTKEIEDQFIEHCKSPMINGISILGGEPMQQIKDDTLLKFVKRIKEEVDKPIWIWTGYTMEELIKRDNFYQLATLATVDVVIDGPFIQSKKDISLKYRGSSNQRVIDIKKSLKHSALACGYSMLMSEYIDIIDTEEGF